MVEQELMRAAYRERMREAARMARQSEARALRDERPSSRGGSSGLRGRRLALPSFVARAFWPAPPIAGRRDASR